MAKRNKKNRKQKGAPSQAPAARSVAPVQAPVHSVAPVVAPVVAEEVALQVVSAVVEQIAAAIDTDPDDTPPPEGDELASSASDDKRAHPRVSLAVAIHLGSESHFFVDLSGDLSEGGVFVQTYRDIKVGSDVALEFSLPNGAVHTHGKVRWHRSASDSSPPGLGIAFKKLSERDKNVIHTFCQQRAPLYYDVEQAS